MHLMNWLAILVNRTPERNEHPSVDYGTIGPQDSDDSKWADPGGDSMKEAGRGGSEGRGKGGTESEEEKKESESARKRSDLSVDLEAQNVEEEKKAKCMIEKEKNENDDYIIKLQEKFGKSKNNNNLEEEKSSSVVKLNPLKIEKYEENMEECFSLTWIGFDDDFDTLCDLIQSCISHHSNRIVFKKCKIPLISEENVEDKKFETPEGKLRPLYGVSFEECLFKKCDVYDKADQIGLLLNCEGLPSRSPSGDPQQVGGGISSITFKNNGFSEVEMAKLKVYLCYAENLMIYEEN
ncbi:unnamed protein product [Moneuplotes crassus]|uniref:Uncharacterized protein n=1 Tax=Euplotes crassus TaxID=5936 RepID=A0AAD1U514_EUPCR|nr:unnamed protein product [Moneuplotes crassus]